MNLRWCERSNLGCISLMIIVISSFTFLQILNRVLQTYTFTTLDLRFVYVNNLADFLLLIMIFLGFILGIWRWLNTKEEYKPVLDKILGFIFFYVITSISST